MSEVLVTNLFLLLLRLHTKEQSLVGVGHARLVEEVRELIIPMLLLRLRLVKLVDELRLLELKLLGLLFELADLGFVEESVLVEELLCLLPPLAQESCPLLLAEFAGRFCVSCKLLVIVGSLLILALQKLFSVVEVFLEDCDFLVSLLEVAVYPLASNFLILLPPFVVLSVLNNSHLFPSLLFHPFEASFLVLFLY